MFPGLLWFSHSHVTRDQLNRIAKFLHFLKPYQHPLLRFDKNQTTATKTINNTTDTTTAIAIIVPLETPSLLDTLPEGLERSDGVEDFAMVAVGLTSDVAGLVVGVSGLGTGSVGLLSICESH